jgi:hypothetical protein
MQRSGIQQRHRWLVRLTTLEYAGVSLRQRSGLFIQDLPDFCREIRVAEWLENDLDAGI